MSGLPRFRNLLPGTERRMHLDFKELLSILNEHRVKYLIVGAYAVAIHAQPRIGWHGAGVFTSCRF
jgi:hypothetical protein